MARKSGSGSRQTSEYYRIRDRQKKHLQRLVKDGALTSEQAEVMMLPTEAEAKKLNLDLTTVKANAHEVTKAMTELRALMKEKDSAPAEVAEKVHAVQAEVAIQKTQLAQARVKEAIMQEPKRTGGYEPTAEEMTHEEIRQKIEQATPLQVEVALETAGRFLEPGIQALEARYPHLRDDIMLALNRMGIAGASDADRKAIADFVRTAPVRELLRGFGNASSYVGLIYEQGSLPKSSRLRSAMLGTRGYGVVPGKDVLKLINEVKSRKVDGKERTYAEIKSAYDKYKDYPLSKVRKAARTEGGYDGIPRWAAKVVLSPTTYGGGIDWEMDE